MAVEITKLRGLKSVYTRHLKGLEMELEKELVDFTLGSEEHIVHLSGLRKSYLSDVEKIQAQNDNILALLKGQELENELFENLNQGSNYNRTLAKIDFYLNKVLTVAFSLENLNILCSTQSYENKVKLPRIELSKFNGDIIEWKGFWDQFKSTVHEDKQGRNGNNQVLINAYKAKVRSNSKNTKF